jgi:hypothetical protein
LELLSAEPAFDLVDYGDLPHIEGIVSNIIYRGMPNVAEQVLGLTCKGKCGG